MSDSNEYPVKGNVDFLAEQAFVDVLQHDDTITAIFGSPDLVNIRRAKDKKTAKRTLPAMSVDAIPEQTIPRTNEYRCRMQIFCVTQADNDSDGQKVQALAGAVRDAIHADSTSTYPGHFKGDCNGFLEALNATERGIVFHQVHEGASEPRDEGRTRRMVVNLDVWGYPGTVSQ